MFSLSLIVVGIVGMVALCLGLFVRPDPTSWVVPPRRGIDHPDADDEGV